MSSILHTHKKAIMIVVMVPIGVSMLFFGLSGPTGNSNQGADFTAPIATIGNVNITAAEFIQHYNQVAKSRAVDGTEPSPQELAAAGVVDQLVDDLIKRGVFRAKAQESAPPETASSAEVGSGKKRPATTCSRTRSSRVTGRPRTPVPRYATRPRDA